MKSRVKDQARQTLLQQIHRAEERGKVTTYIAMCAAFSECGICDNTIRKATDKICKITEQLSEELNGNTVKYAGSKTEKVDYEYNREKLVEYCNRLGFKCDEHIFDRIEMPINGEKTIL